MINLIAQATQPAALPFFERIATNDTVRFTTAAGWLTLLSGVIGGFIVGKLVRSALRRLAGRLQSRGWPMRAILARSLAGPVDLGFIGLGLSIGIGKLAPSEQLSESASKGLGLLYITAVGWLLYNLIELIDASLRQVASTAHLKLNAHLASMVSKTLRVFLVIIVALFAAENVFSANISAWLAGLGIAGLAVSLAAQDSIKNIFGSITILMDQPFTIGDFVVIGDFTGVVEEVGFRSTRLRTPQGSLVTIPNSRVADASIDNMARRQTIRRVMDLTLTFHTPLPNVQRAVQTVRDVLAQPEIAANLDAQNPPRVYFDAINAGSLNVKVFYWFTPVDYWKYLEHCERVNLLILEKLSGEGIEMAFPTRTLHIAPAPPAMGPLKPA